MFAKWYFNKFSHKMKVCAIILPMSIKKYLDRLEDFTGKEILITGGTSGIGLSIVKQLLYKHAKVVVLARNLEKAEDVKNKLLALYPDNPISVIKYDQSDDESIIEASDEIIKNHSNFYALILNAGIIQSKKNISYKDDYPLTIKTNFVGVANFLEYLLPKLNGQHRFVLQGSLVAGWKVKKVDSLKTKEIPPFKLYAFSKAGVESLFYHYTTTTNTDFSFYLVEPGIIITDIIREFPSFIRWLANIVNKPFKRNVDKASLTALLALSSQTPPSSFIVPRGLFAIGGYPQIKRFPEKRKRPHLYDLLKENK